MTHVLPTTGLFRDRDLFIHDGSRLRRFRISASLQAVFFVMLLGLVAWASYATARLVTRPLTMSLLAPGGRGWLLAICVSRVGAYMVYIAYAATLPVLQREWNLSGTAAGSIAAGMSGAAPGFAAEPGKFGLTVAMLEVDPYPIYRELRDHQLTWQAASLLLSYPDEQLLGHAPLLRAALAHLPDGQSTPLGRFLSHVEATPVLKLAADYAPGLPKKKDFGPLERLRVGQMLDYIVQAHNADRAGPHHDIRFGDKDMGLLSWASRKGVPEPGAKHLAVQQPVHRHEYKDFEGEIPEGYGKGTVKKHTEGQVLITKQALRKLPKDANVRPVGSIQMKGKKGLVELFEVVWEPAELTQVKTIAESASDNVRLVAKFGETAIELGHNRPVLHMGRGDDNEFVIADPLASRMHARIEFRRDRFVLIDQSLNGTYLHRQGMAEITLRRDEIGLERSGQISLGKPIAAALQSALRGVQRLQVDHDALQRLFLPHNA
jgi:hypothetical protein